MTDQSTYDEPGALDDADVTELERLRKESAAEYAKSNLKLTALAFVIKAVSLSLRQHPAGHRCDGCWPCCSSAQWRSRRETGSPR